MATFTDRNNVDLDILAKGAVGKAARSTNFLTSGEPITTNRIATADKIYLNAPPATPPVASTDSIKVHTAAADGVIRLTRELDDASGTSWLAFPAHRTGHASGAAGPEVNATVLTNFLTDKDGYLYTVKYFLADGTRILPTGQYGPFLVPESGVVRYSAPLPAGNDGSSEATSPYIEAYRLQGLTLADLYTNELKDGTMVDDMFFCGLLNASFIAGTTP